MALFKRNKDKGKRLADGSGDERPVDKPKRKRPASAYPVPLLHPIPCLYCLYRSLMGSVADPKWLNRRYRVQATTSQSLATHLDAQERPPHALCHRLAVCADRSRAHLGQQYREFKGRLFC
jgi:hypothetical protein